MTTKRAGLLAGTILGGVLVIGISGLAFATDPTSAPTPNATSGTWGQMGGQGMMGGQGVMGGQGMMGGASAGQMSDMTATHEAMNKDGTCDPGLMQSMHRTDKAAH